MLPRTAKLFAIILTLAGAHAQAAPGDISVQFLASPASVSSPGHAFVCIQLDLNAGVKEDCFGFYPVDMNNVFDGAGNVEAELSRTKTPDRFSTVTTSFSHRIEEAQRTAIYAEVAKWAGAKYDLLVANCGDMVFAVARAAGLVTPPRATVVQPVAFVEGIKKLLWAGEYRSDDEQQRFRMFFSVGSVQVTERSSDANELVRNVAFAPTDSMGQIKRDNDDAALAFLGFQPTLRTQILRAGPKPSYWNVERVADRIDVMWFGLRVVKDDQANLKRLEQPGSQPGAPFTLRRNGTGPQ